MPLLIIKVEERKLCCGKTSKHVVFSVNEGDSLMTDCTECVKGRVTERQREERASFVAYYVTKLLCPCEDCHALSVTARGMNSVIIIFEPV